MHCRPCESRDPLPQGAVWRRLVVRDCDLPKPKDSAVWVLAFARTTAFVAASTNALSSLRKQGPITTGSRLAKTGRSRLRPAKTERFRGMGPGFRQDDSIRSRLHKCTVVPAKAGTHYHREPFCEDWSFETATCQDRKIPRYGSW